MKRRETVKIINVLIEEEIDNEIEANPLRGEGDLEND